MIVRVTVVLQLRCRSLNEIPLARWNAGRIDVHVRKTGIRLYEELVERWSVLEVGSADVIMISGTSERVKIGESLLG
jgi:hypothetical protein